MKETIPHHLQLPCFVFRFGNRHVMTLHECASTGDLDGVRKALRRGATVDSIDEQGYTLLARAAEGPQADEAMLRLLIEAGADVNRLVEEGRHFPLELAARSGHIGKVQCLLEAGANINLTSHKGYTALISTVYGLNDQVSLVPMLELFLQHGAVIDCVTDYGESPLSVASRCGRFDAVGVLLNAGADPSPLQWSPLLKAAALGTVDEVDRLLKSNVKLDDEDRFSRTALHLASLVDDVQKAELLHARGCEINRMDRSGETALMTAAMSGKSKMVQWLITHGADLESVNGMDCTPLMAAAQAGQTECVRLLLEAGADADHHSQFQDTALSLAANESIIRLLIGAGQGLSNINTEMKRQLIGLPMIGPIIATAAGYRAGKNRRFGRLNPEVMHIPFWQEMVRAGVGAYQARKRFGDENCFGSEPVWCFQRYGMSFTELPDGRFVQIGGEHEDFYDPDFCIYNEVVVHDRSGQFEIMGYPEDVFPPTDFHTATLVNDFIFIIGRLGYHGTRAFGTTPVYRLHCRTWKIEAVVTRGDNPGWIYKHSTSFDGSHGLTVSGGTICQEISGEEQHVENEAQFQLDLNGMKWSRL